MSDKRIWSLTGTVNSIEDHVKSIEARNDIRDAGELSYWRNRIEKLKSDIAEREKSNSSLPTTTTDATDAREETDNG